MARPASQAPAQPDPARMSGLVCFGGWTLLMNHACPVHFLMDVGGIVLMDVGGKMDTFKRPIYGLR